MARKPLYGRILSSRTFERREDAVAFAKDYKEEYKAAEESVKYDINREQQGWTATIYLKVD